MVDQSNYSNKGNSLDHRDRLDTLIGRIPEETFAYGGGAPPHFEARYRASPEKVFLYPLPDRCIGFDFEDEAHPVRLLEVVTGSHTRFTYDGVEIEISEFPFDEKTGVH